MQSQDGYHHPILRGDTETITFRNESEAGVAVAGEAFWRPQAVFRFVDSTCRGNTIGPGNTCVIRIRKDAENNANRYYYLGDAAVRAVGGVILR